MVEDPEVPGLFHPCPTGSSDSTALVSSVGSAEDCRSDFRSCLASATVWNLKCVLIKIVPDVSFRLMIIIFELLYIFKESRILLL